MFSKFAILTSLSIAVATSAFGETYKIDTEGAHASINFETSHLGYAIIAGRFDSFDGTFEYDAANPAAGSVSITIDASSINSNHAARDNHLRSGDFFDVETHPTANFTSTGIEVSGDTSAVITGDLTIRGITKSVQLDSTFIGEGKDPWGGYRAGFKGSTTIQLGDFGMDGMLGNAPVNLSLFVEGIRQ